MLIYNLDRSDVPSDIRLVNGSRGIICELVDLKTAQRELEEEERGRDVAHAAPSIALDGRSEPANLTMTRSSVLKQYCENLRAKTQGVDSLLFPRVQFINGVCKLITPCCFNQTLYDGGYVFRLQLPIKCRSPLFRHFTSCSTLIIHRLAWCLTIHKVQGASIDFLEVDLEGCFEYGQAYVALSRARSADGLSVRNFDVRCIKTHDGAKRFHQVGFAQHKQRWHLSAHSLQRESIRDVWDIYTRRYVIRALTGGYRRSERRERLVRRGSGQWHRTEDAEEGAAMVERSAKSEPQRMAGAFSQKPRVQELV